MIVIRQGILPKGSLLEPSVDRQTSCIGAEAPITHGDVAEQDDCGPTGVQKIQHQGRRHAQSNRATRQYDERPGAFGL